MGQVTCTLWKMSSPPQMTCVFETCLRDKTGSNCKSQLRYSFLKTLLLVWKVDVAELHFWNCQLLLTQPTNHWFLASQWQRGREHVNCSIQVWLDYFWCGKSIAELIVDIANCSCLKPPITDSLLRNGSKEEKMLTAPFKSCWRPWRSSFRCPTSRAWKPDPLCIISQKLASTAESQCCWAHFWNCQLLLSQATSHWFLSSQWQLRREHVNCSIQILLEAV